MTEDARALGLKEELERHPELKPLVVTPK